MIARLTAGAAIAASAAALLPSSAAAHGLAAKQDLPIPKWLFTWAATAVLVASFLALAGLWKRPLLQEARERTLRLPLPRLLQAACGLGGIAAFTGLIYAGYAGAQVSTANIVPTTVFVVFWIGIPILSAVAGDLFRAFNPWLAFARLVGWTAQRIAGERLPKPLAYPDRLGYFPAAAGLVAFVWIELIYPGREDPSSLATLALLYAAIQLIGMSLYGTQAWTSRADAFSVYFSMFARLSPLRWSTTELNVRAPLSGAPRTPIYVALALLCCTMIGTTSFDGLTQGPLWNSVVADLQSAATNLDLSPKHALQLVQTLALLAMTAVIFGIYRIGIDGIRGLENKRSSREIADDFAHTLIPIALAYVVAHYFGLLAYQGQAVGYLISDPLGNGADYFGTASATIDYSWITPEGVWYTQVAALVAGHVAGLALAHDRALARFQDTRVAVRSQYWMLAVMVGFTSLGLWLLSAGS